MPRSGLSGLITDGIIAGVGGVLTFLPQIALLFFFLSLLEDSGYMAQGCVYHGPVAPALSVCRARLLSR